jgi:DNA-binding transcriptional regulator YiaG
MPNLAAVLKKEIRRLARREVKAEVNAVRRATGQHRHDIAGLKRQLQIQERRLAALQSQTSARKQPAESEGLPPGVRFSPRSVRAQRKRLKLSAEQYGQLIGVTGQTIYLWEKGKTRPGKAQFAALVAVRSLGRREALKRLKQGRS